MNIKIRCIVCNSRTNYQFHIKIFNEQGQKIQEITANHLELIESVILNRGFYTIEIETSGIIRKEKVWINQYTPKILNFYFSLKASNKQTLITIIVTDQNYAGLPIEKGRITLWQNKFKFQ